MTYPNLVAAANPQSVLVTSLIPSNFTPGQVFTIGPSRLTEVNADGTATSVPLGSSGPFLIEIDDTGEHILCSSMTREGLASVYVYGDTNGRGWDSTTPAAVSPGALATVASTSAQDDLGGGGGGGAFAGSSPQNPVWLAPVAWIYQSTFGFEIDPYTYDNGADGVGATVTQNTPGDGPLSIDGGMPALGDRVLFYEYEGNGISTGIYTVTALGDGDTVPWVLTRSTDTDTAATLFEFWGVGVVGTGEVFPTGSQFIVSFVQVGDVGTGYVYGSLSTNSTASGTNSTASGTNSTASGTFSTASGTNSTASGTFSTASGTFSTASGTNSTASGTNSTASGTFSTASGTFSTASGTNSTASGTNSTASGAFSTASGTFSTAYGDGQTAVAAGDTDSPNQSLSSTVVGFIPPENSDTPTPFVNLNNAACLIRFVDNNGVAAFNKTLLVSAKLVARRVDVYGTDSAWTIQGVLRGAYSVASLVADTGPTFPLTITEGVNDQFVFTPQGGNGTPLTFTIAAGTYTDIDSLTAGLDNAQNVGGVGNTVFSSRAGVTNDGTTLTLTMIGTAGAADNGNTITEGNGAAALLGFTANPDTFAGGTSSYTWVGGSAPTPTLVAQDDAASTWAVSIDVGTDPANSGAAALIGTFTGDGTSEIAAECTLVLDEVCG